MEEEKNEIMEEKEQERKFQEDKCKKKKGWGGKRQELKESFATTIMSRAQRHENLITLLVNL